MFSAPPPATNGAKPLGLGGLKADLLAASPADLLGSHAEGKDDGDDTEMDDVPEVAVAVVRPSTPKTMPHQYHKMSSISSAAKSKNSQEPTLEQWLEQLPTSLPPLLIAMKDKCVKMTLFFPTCSSHFYIP